MYGITLGVSVDIEITILNWEKYNPQNFKTRYPHWFRLDREITRSKTLLDLTAEEKWVWVALLCVGCRHVGEGGVIKTSLKWLAREADVSVEAIKIALQKLVTANALAINWQSIGNVEATTEQDITLQDRTEQKNDAKISKKAPPELGAARRSESKVPSGDFKTLIGEYCAAYKCRYNARPVIDGRTQGLVKRVVTDVGLETARLLVQTYLQMDDPWFKTKAHDFVTFYENLTKISASMQTGKTVGQKPDQYRPIWELLREEESDDGEKLRNPDNKADDPVAKLLRE